MTPEKQRVTDQVAQKIEEMTTVRLTCDMCHQVKADAKERPCPYMHEIYDDETLYNICDDCYSERCMDI